MKIAIITDKSRLDFLPSEEAKQEDNQKRTTVKEIERILSKKYDCISFYADDDLIIKLREEEVDLVFNMCNGLVGDNKLGQIPAMLEFANIPYTASSSIGHTLASNKSLSAQVFENANIKTPRYKLIYSLEDLNDFQLDFPIIVKPNDEGSSRGIHQDSLVFNMKELKSKLEKSLEIYQPPILLNEYIEGKEFSIGVIGNGEDAFALPIQEVDFSGLPEDMKKFYSFEVKTYYKSDVVYHIPARLSDEETKLVQETAVKAFNSLLLKDYGRVDIILKDGIAYVLEINSLPGLMKDSSSLFRMAESLDELGYEELIFKIVETARKRYNL